MTFPELTANRVVHDITEVISKQSTLLLWIHRTSQLLLFEDAALEEPPPALKTSGTPCYELFEGGCLAIAPVCAGADFAHHRPAVGYQRYILKEQIA